MYSGDFFKVKALTYRKYPPPALGDGISRSLNLEHNLYKETLSPEIDDEQLSYSRQSLSSKVARGRTLEICSFWEITNSAIRFQVQVVNLLLRSESRAAFSLAPSHPQNTKIALPSERKGFLGLQLRFSV